MDEAERRPLHTPPSETTNDDETKMKLALQSDAGDELLVLEI